MSRRSQSSRSASFTVEQYRQASQTQQNNALTPYQENQERAEEARLLLQAKYTIWQNKKAVLRHQNSNRGGQLMGRDLSPIRQLKSFNFTVRRLREQKYQQFMRKQLSDYEDMRI